mmetsp:Transcript_80915/g.142749  ORF Transcript_80915/g.142749 Transcript_80915/m.142749 type:complete len:643 (-) Transcript_80915:30-1958(-)
MELGPVLDTPCLLPTHPDPRQLSYQTGRIAGVKKQAPTKAPHALLSSTALLLASRRCCRVALAAAKKKHAAGKKSPSLCFHPKKFQLLELNSEDISEEAKDNMHKYSKVDPDNPTCWQIPRVLAVQAVSIAQEHDVTVHPKVLHAVANSQASTARDAPKDSSIDFSQLKRWDPISGVKLELKPFQRAGVELILRERRCFLADEMGLGKTVQALAALELLGDCAYPALVVCPLSVKFNWTEEVLRWAPLRKACILTSKDDPNKLPEDVDVVIVNFELLKSTNRLKYALEKGFQSLIVDECHKLKTGKADRTKALVKVSDTIPQEGLILMLSGTPVLNRPVELIAQLKVLHRIKHMGGVMKFRERYCAPKKVKYGRMEAAVWDYSGADNIDELNEMLRQTCFLRRAKYDVLQDLPRKTSYEVEVDLDPDDLQEHQDRLDEFWNAYQFHDRDDEDGHVLQQLGEMRHNLGIAKIDCARQWIDEFLKKYDRKLIVFAHHRIVVNTLADEYGNLRVAGDDSEKERQKAVNKFQQDPGARVIVLNMQAGSHGINLTAASDVLFVEQSWVPAEHDQAEDRAHRIGQTKPVRVWNMLARDTLDEDMKNTRERKRKIVDVVTEGFAALRGSAPHNEFKLSHLLAKVLKHHM